MCCARPCPQGVLLVPEVFPMDVFKGVVKLMTRGPRTSGKGNSTD
jgi:hypothetical protein